MGADLTGPDPRGPRRLGAWPPQSLLGGLVSATRDDLLSLGTLQRLGSGETIIVEGDRDSRDVFVLLEGVVKVVSNTAEGITVLLSIRADGDVVGELAGLDGNPRLASVITVKSCVVRRIGQRDFVDFLERHADAALAVNRSVSAKLRNATWHRVEYGSSPVPIRLARILIQLADQYGERVPEGIMIRLELTHPELGTLVGAREPTVQKALRSLRKDGVIDTGYRRVVIRDRAALHSVAGITEIPPEYGVRHGST